MVQADLKLWPFKARLSVSCRSAAQVVSDGSSDDKPLIEAQIWA